METMERLLLESKKRLGYLVKKYHCMSEEGKRSECTALVHEIGLVSKTIENLKREINHD